MHRHLLGLNSPPADSVFDRLATSLGLPQDWHGDAWVHSNGRGYFLRAWNVTTGGVAYGEGLRFNDARQQLLNDLTEGNRRVKISIQEYKMS